MKHAQMSHTNGQSLPKGLLPIDLLVDSDQVQINFRLTLPIKTRWGNYAMTKNFNEILKLPTQELLSLYGQILTTLRERQVVRSANNPIADLAEKLVCDALSLDLSTKQSNKGFDATDANQIRYQIKARRITALNGSTQLGAIRGLDGDNFDFLIGVLFNEDFTVHSACQIPRVVVLDNSKFREHVNAWIFHLRPFVWKLDGVDDLTDKVKSVKVA